jgi:GT2 family glycosyltransferase
MNRTIDASELSAPDDAEVTFVSYRTRDAEFCHWARELGYRLTITPDARNMHLIGASTACRAEKVVALMRDRVTPIRNNWPRWQVLLRLGMLRLLAATRDVASLLAPWPDRRAQLRYLWPEGKWLAGFASR